MKDSMCDRLALLCIVATVLEAQTTSGVILGRVTDSTGAVIAKANVTLRPAARCC